MEGAIRLYDQRSFILGMVTAFCECVAGGCKRMALSPPMTDEAWDMASWEATDLVRKHGLVCFHEENKDMPEENRFHWLVIAARQETLDEYLRLRAEGCKPSRGLKPFYALLSYNEAQAVHTGYDAYRELFMP